MRSSSVGPFAGQRLRLARYRACLTARELAERSGVTPSAISQYETGRAVPTLPVVAALAMACGVSRDYFSALTRPISPSGLDGTHFRSLRSTTKQARGRAFYWAEAVLDLADALEQFVELPATNLPATPLPADASVEDIEGAVAALRLHWQLPVGPVGNLVRQMESQGILVAALSSADRGVDAYSHFQGARPVVVLATDKNDAARSRFDAAHELGHLLCHPDADPGAKQEQQAHAFAAELLMPRREIHAALPRRFDLNAYAKLKHIWGVSIHALLYRARALEVISEPAFRRSMMTLSRDYGRTNEPFPLPAREQPVLLRMAVDVAQGLGADLVELADRAHLTLDDVQAIIGPDARPAVELAP